MPTHSIHFQPFRYMPNGMSARINNFTKRNPVPGIIPTPPPQPCIDGNYDISATVYTQLSNIYDYRILINNGIIYLYAKKPQIEGWITNIGDLAPLQGAFVSAISLGTVGSCLVKNGSNTYDIYFTGELHDLNVVKLYENIPGPIQLRMGSIYTGYFNSSSIHMKRQFDLSQTFDYTAQTVVHDCSSTHFDIIIIDGTKLLIDSMSRPQDPTVEITVNITNFNKIQTNTEGKFGVIASNTEASYADDIIRSNPNPSWTQVTLPANTTILMLNVYKVKPPTGPLPRAFILMCKLNDIEQIHYFDINGSVTQVIPLPSPNVTVVKGIITRTEADDGYIIKAWMRDTKGCYLYQIYDIDSSTWSTPAMPPIVYP